MISKICRFILKLWGWKIIGKYPHELDKYIIVVMPHTSAWDLPLGFLLKGAWKSPTKYLGKDDLFKPPFGWLFYALGGYPVNRSKSNNFVDAVVDLFNSKEKFAVTISPEGTRKKVDRLKTGFYYIAKGANVPLVLMKFDFGKMEVEIAETFYPTWDKEKDFEMIYDFFKGAKGKIPEYGFLYDQ